MSRDLDPHLQRIIDNAELAASEDPVPEFSFPRVESRTAQRGLGSIWSFQENHASNDLS